MLAPLAPHIAEELWSRLGHAESLAWQQFPVVDEALLVDDTDRDSGAGQRQGAVGDLGRRRRRRGRAGGRGAEADEKVAAALAGPAGQAGHRRTGPADQLRRLTLAAMASQQRVTVVTDSTSYLPAGLAEELGVRVVAAAGAARRPDRPGGHRRQPGRRDRRAAGTGSRSPPPGPRRPSSSRCTGRRWTAGAQRGGVAAPVGRAVRHLRLGPAGRGRVRPTAVVRVIDSRSAGDGARVRGAGRGPRRRPAAPTPDEVEQARPPVAASATSALFYVDSLEWLHRGGRIGAAAARFGTALAVKPLLHLSDGRIVPLEKVRTASKAIARLVQLTRGRGRRPTRSTSRCSTWPRRSGPPIWPASCGRRCPTCGELYESEVGAAVGAHVGPGLLGIVVGQGRQRLSSARPSPLRAVPGADRELRVEGVVAADRRCSA